MHWIILVSACWAFKSRGCKIQQQFESLNAQLVEPTLVNDEIIGILGQPDQQHVSQLRVLAMFLVGFDASATAWQWHLRLGRAVPLKRTGEPKGGIADDKIQAQTQTKGKLLEPSASSPNAVPFDSAAIGGLFVEAQPGEWKMWYHGRSLNAPPDVVPLSMGSIGYASSVDGLTWKKNPTGATFGPREEEGSTFDSVLVGMGSILTRGVNEAPWLYYFGGGEEPFEPRGPGGPVLRGVRQTIGLARGEGWGDRCEILERGDSDAWDSLFLASPQVIEHVPGDFRMYYHSMTAGRFSIGLATSSDGISWEKQGQILLPGPNGSWDSRGCSRRFVMRDPKASAAGYIMFYEGSGDGNRHGIGVAYSPDGVSSWKRRSEDDALVFDALSDGAGTRAVSSPFVIQVPGESDVFRLYYMSIAEDGSSGVGVVETTLEEFPAGPSASSAVRRHIITSARLVDCIRTAQPLDPCE